jgi:hypothetical protein
VTKQREIPLIFKCHHVAALLAFSVFSKYFVLKALKKFILPMKRCWECIMNVPLASSSEELQLTFGYTKHSNHNNHRNKTLVRVCRV